MDDTLLSLSDSFKQLKRLAKNIEKYDASLNLRVRCVLSMNRISEDCANLDGLLKDCFELNQFQYEPEPILSFCLTQLVDGAKNNLRTFLDLPDRFEDLTLWVNLLKILYESFMSVPGMWIDSSSPKELRSRLLMELYKRDENHDARKKLTESPEFSDFLILPTREELYAKFVKDTIDNLRDVTCGALVRAIDKIMREIPDNFKFSEGFFKELIRHERPLMDLHGDEKLPHVYKLMFFAYEHSTDPAQICQTYANNACYLRFYREKRAKTARELFAEWSFKAVVHAFEGENLKANNLLRWLYVIHPESLLFASLIDFIQPLPVFPSEDLR